nr:hypothetical protein BaRGS_032939 [Batillaria attramentaria]
MQMTAITVAAPRLKDREEEFIKTFVLQYRDGKDDDWHVVLNDLKENVKVGVHVTQVRILPEQWTGKNPEMFINLLGCDIDTSKK